MIIVSVTGPTTAEALAQIQRSRKYASMFEFRLDLMGVEAAASLVKAARKPVVLTYRPRWEGGGYAGPDVDRIAVLARAPEIGARYVDLEFRMGVPLIRRFIKECKSIRVIGSRHYFDGQIPDPDHEYRSLRAAGTYAMKFAYRAGDAADTSVAFRFLARAAADRTRAVAIAMGEAGEPSRILYRVFGGWATYASPVGGPAAAEGQLPADALQNIFHADRLTRSTRVFGVIGDPVRYSKGIYIHNPLFRRAHTNAVYCRFAVSDLGRFMSAVAPSITGMSVTLPHKVSIIRFLDGLDESARNSGAVNTVVRRRGSMIGLNTDGAGALDAIEKRMKVKNRSFLVIGAGGAARAIVVEAVRRGANVLIANRSPEAAQDLARRCGANVIELPRVQQCDIVANATSVGMAPDVDRTPIPPGAIRMELAFDAVYQPRETRFLREAKARGAITVSGAEMYLNQAAAQSQLYTGTRPDQRLMRRTLAKVLEP